MPPDKQNPGVPSSLLKKRSVKEAFSHPLHEVTKEAAEKLINKFRIMKAEITSLQAEVKEHHEYKAASKDEQIALHASKKAQQARIEDEQAKDKTQGALFAAHKALKQTWEEEAKRDSEHEDTFSRKWKLKSLPSHEHGEKEERIRKLESVLKDWEI